MYTLKNAKISGRKNPSGLEIHHEGQVMADTTTFVDHSLGEGMEALEILAWNGVRSFDMGMTPGHGIRVLGLNPSSAVY